MAPKAAIGPAVGSMGLGLGIRICIKGKGVKGEGLKGKFLGLEEARNLARLGICLGVVMTLRI